MNTVKLCLMILLISSIDGYPSDHNSENDCSNYCFNNGICVSPDNIRQCYCLPEWEGERCDSVRESDTIYIDPSQQTIKYDLRNHPCTLVPNLCANGGLCQFENNSFSCACTHQFYGKRCEKLSPCNNNFCKNGGLCTLEGDNPKCNCNGTLFEGLMCHVFTTTTIAPQNTTMNPICDAYKEFCNGGSCIMVGASPTCQCQPTQSGQFCEISQPVTQPGMVTTPFNPGQGSSPPPASGITCANNPCRNNRPCYPNGNSYFCFCGNQFSGYNCENPAG